MRTLLFVLAGLAIALPAAAGSHEGEGEAPFPFNAMKGPGEDGEISIPICLTGTLATSPDESSCMDTATHVVQTADTPPVESRLVAGSEKAREALVRLTGAKGLVTVCGNLTTHGPRCPLLSAFHAEPAETFQEKLSD